MLISKLLLGPMWQSGSDERCLVTYINALFMTGKCEDRWVCIIQDLQV